MVILDRGYILQGGFMASMRSGRHKFVQVDTDVLIYRLSDRTQKSLGIRHHWIILPQRRCLRVEFNGAPVLLIVV